VARFAFRVPGSAFWFGWLLVVFVVSGTPLEVRNPERETRNSERETRWSHPTDVSGTVWSGMRGWESPHPPVTLPSIQYSYHKLKFNRLQSRNE
jgi:hypothetical protein